MILLIDVVALRILHSLDDDLFGRLNGDPAEGARFDLDAEAVARFRFLIQGASRFRNGDMEIRIQNLFHHCLELEDLDLTGFLVVMGLQFDIGPQLLVSRRQHGILQGLDDNLPVYSAILAHLFDQALKFGKHSINLRYHSIDAKRNAGPYHLQLHEKKVHVTTHTLYWP